MRNIFDEKDSEKLIARLHKLKSETLPIWGKLTVNGMLFHCHTVNKAILSGKNPRPASFRQKLMRIYVLDILRKMPMGRQSHPNFFASGQVLDFNQEREQLIETIRAFNQHKEIIQVGHPVFGSMKNRDWGRFAWIHLDHHLRQFGV